MKNRITNSSLKWAVVGTCFGILGLLSVTVKTTSATAQNSLNLQTAVRIAQENDPWLVRNIHTQNSVESLSIASGTLPDPKVSLALANLATDTFDFDQEPMTQFKVGVSQMIPRGDTLNLKQKKLEVISRQFPLQRQDRKAKIDVMVSGLWLEAYKAQESISLIEKDRPLFEQLVDVVEASYSAAFGKTRQQDIIRAQLELTRLDDRLSRLTQKQEMAIESMVGWVSGNFLENYLEGNSSNQISTGKRRLLVDKTLPEIEMFNTQLFTSAAGVDPQELYVFFANHPSVLNIDQKMRASDVDVDLTRQKYKPEWGVNASYGYRDDAQNGTDRADFVSVGITFDVPLFTGKRQDKQLAAAQSQSLSVGTEKWLLLRQMIADFEKFKAQLLRLNERDNLYTETLLPQMHEQAEASLTAYTNDDGDFAEVVRSRIAELNSQIDALNIRVERQKTITKLNYYFTKNDSEDSADKVASGEQK